jgi:hypothetical protein
MIVVTARTCEVEPKKLRTIYSDNFIPHIPIDKGGIEALIPKSNAYSHLHQTNVKSYAIAGTYRPSANNSHNFQESYYQTVVDSNQVTKKRRGGENIAWKKPRE